MSEMRPSQYPMVSVHDALDIVLSSVRLMPSEIVDIAQAHGRVLAEDIRASEHMPPFAASSVDGYALRAADGDVDRRVLSEITAGHTSAIIVGAHQAMRIMTGAPVPPGADAVVMVEETTEADGVLSLHAAVQPGNNVIPVGLDVTVGQDVLALGAVLGSAELALLATVGYRQIKAYRRPIVAVLSTGDELVEPGAPLAPGKIRDSNRYGLLAAAAEAGCTPLSLDKVRDDPAEQEQRIRDGLSRADVVLTSGGVSVGSRDLIKPILERLGTVHFGRVAIKPGKPLTFATIGDKLAFGLPGFPVSSLVTFELFVRPALLKMQGRNVIHRPLVTASMEHPVQQTPDRVEFQRAIVREEHGRLFARTTGLQVSSRVLSLVGANALLRISPGGGIIAAGESVQAVLLASL